jgi:hypothetical protein
LGGGEQQVVGPQDWEARDDRAAFFIVIFVFYFEWEVERWKKEEGRRKKEEGRRKKEEGKEKIPPSMIASCRTKIIIHVHIFSHPLDHISISHEGTRGISLKQT